MIQLISTPSAVALLQEVRARLVAHTPCSTTVEDVWQLLDVAAVDLGVPARAHVLAGNALDMALCADPPSLLAAVDLATCCERERRLDIDRWLATRPGRSLR